MKSIAIPQWNLSGVLPPINSTVPTSTDRSPYPVTLVDLVLRYATSPERCKILEGFLGFRSALHAAGIDNGFQWVDGSFVEDVEWIKSRPPEDIDVVTFFYLPDATTRQSLFMENPNLFTPVNTKADYTVDAYFLILNTESPEELVRGTSYWYSLWSHRRDNLWKGYLQIDLSPIEDTNAKQILSKIVNQGGRQ